ncbi:MAG TPA: porin [Pirellulales bacterium]|nr:porin [Pirellulales bacterium]
MRDGPRMALGGLVAAFVAWAGLSQAHGQQGFYAPVAPAGYNDGAAASDQNSVIDELRRRLDANEAEIRALRAQQQQQQPGVSATPTAFDANANASAAAAPDAANPFCTPKEVPIITSPTFRVGAKVFIDNVDINQSQRNINATGNPKELDYTGLTYLRLYAEGWVYENVDYKFEIECASNAIVPALATPTVQNPPGPNVAGATWTKTQIVETIQLKDIYATVRYLPVMGNLRIGHFKEPWMLEELTSDEWLEFERRALPDNFAPARKWGVMAFNYVNENKDLSWYMGTFRDTFSDNSFIERSNEGDWSFCARSVWLPYYDEPSDGRYLLHVGTDFRVVGAGGSLTNPTDQKSFSATEEALTLNPFTNTGNVNCLSYEEYDAELAMINGPFSVSGEATWVTLNDVSTVTGATTGRSATYKGAYIQASYFLTGENRGYDREAKRFSTVKPYEPFFRVRTCDGVCMGKGAWEIAARLSYIDMNSVVSAGSGAQPAPIKGGEMTDTTLGVNWYLNQDSGDIA